MKKLVAAVLGMGIALAAPASAQVPDYPARPITLIMPYSAGTGIDTATRALAEKLRVRMKVPFIVQNKVGAGGNIGSEFVARSAPDGYTLLVVANTLAMNPGLYKNLPYDPVRDFAPVGLLFKGAMVLVAGSKVPARNLAEFVAAAAQAPGQYNYASSGVGTPQHLAMELLKEATGMNIMHIPHKGAGEAVTAIAGGQVEVGFVPIQSALVQIEAGTMHALAVSSPARQPALPDVATVAESVGKPFDVDLWYGLFAPAGTPAAIIDKLHRQMQEALADRDMQQSLSAQGMVSAVSTPAELDSLVRTDLARWARVIEARGITPN
ncbi:tripartite tricarboxylate transporter substrate binding protein [Pigmentiphaga sp. CHJ604]|uniref:tripartite tricarboxylate transporter substrate binding protein n=1 Tax=Pigmentiphaga sp. CHJ604 TaxID=3081984 RepID=UPI0030D11E3F